MLSFTISERTINIEEVIKEKAPELYRKLPGFVFPLMRKLLHEKEVNSFLYKERDKTGIDFATAILEDFGCHVSLKGAENVPAKGKLIFCANHPLGGLDGMAFISQIGKTNEGVIVGRCADYVLKDMPGVTNVFIHAEVEDRKKRAIEKYGEDPAKIDDIIATYDKARQNYYNYHTCQKWGDYRNYNLSINSSYITEEEAVGLIVDYVERRTYR